MSINSFNRPVWGYRCEENVCRRIQISPSNIQSLQSSSVCRLSCHKEEFGTIWPKPTGEIIISNTVVQLDMSVHGITINGMEDESGPRRRAYNRFRDMLQKKLPKHEIKSGGQMLTVNSIAQESDMSKSFISMQLSVQLTANTFSIIARHRRELQADDLGGGRRCQCDNNFEELLRLQTWPRNFISAYRV